MTTHQEGQVITPGTMSTKAVAPEGLEGRYAATQPERVGTCIHLGPGNPNVHKEVGNPKVFNQVEGICWSHVWLVGKGLDSAVP